MEVPKTFAEKYNEVHNLCASLLKDQKNVDAFKRLNEIIKESENSFVKLIKRMVIAIYYLIVKVVSEETMLRKESSFSIEERKSLIDTLGNLLDKCFIDVTGVYFNLYGLILFQIYDNVELTVLPVSEEFKLSVVQCTKSLARSVSSDIVFDIYTKTNAPKLCQMISLLVNIAKHEKLRSLRIAAIESLMSFARVYDDEDFQDIVLRKQVAEVFIFYLPGVVTALKSIVLEDEKVGHKIPKIALKALGRIVTLLMQDYEVSDQTLNFDFESFNMSKEPISDSEPPKWKNSEELTEYIKGLKFTPEWYRNTDGKLHRYVIQFSKLTHHSHPKVRMELLNMCENILHHCLRTMPTSSEPLVAIVITLSGDEEKDIAEKSEIILKNLSQQLSVDYLKTFLENLEEGFLIGIDSLPRKFNGIDEREQLSSVNLLIGYINLFGEHCLSKVLLSSFRLSKLMQTLLHVSEIRQSAEVILEECKVLDLETDIGYNWKKFIHFRDVSVQSRLEKLFSLLSKNDSFAIVSDYLLDIIVNEDAHKIEAIYILNGIISGIQSPVETHELIRSIFDTYIDTKYSLLPLSAGKDEYGSNVTIPVARNNVIQVSLLTEGIGRIAQVLKERFRPFIIKVLYSLLEKAGSCHSLIKTTSLAALKDIAVSCGYPNITSLINDNIDYFVFNVERRLNRSYENEKVLSVLRVVLEHSTVDILQHMACIIEDALVHSCDEYKEKHATAYLRLFRVFMSRLRIWFDIEIQEEPIIPRVERYKNVDEFKVSDTSGSSDDLSDKIMNQSAEEMFLEDMKKSEQELRQETESSEEEVLEKPESPLHVKLTAAVLNRSLHFLPSKDKTRKLLVLEILLDGLEVIRDHEDELLPIVHKIWSPLVQRFKETEEPLIVNNSFQLLVTLARLSKQFIKIRTTKEVLPDILLILEKLSKESYLKDRGAAYRYSQNFKLQLRLLENMSQVLINLDIKKENVIRSMETVYKYLSNKQPVPLQVAAMKFFKNLLKYNPVPVLKEIQSWSTSNTEFNKNITHLLTIAQ